MRLARWRLQSITAQIAVIVAASVLLGILLTLAILPWFEKTALLLEVEAKAHGWRLIVAPSVVALTIVLIVALSRELRARVQTLLDDRTRMLAAISHDLRTPLTRLRLRAERAAPAARDGMLRDIERIGRMLDETLEYLRLDLRAERFERIDLASLVQTICAEFADVGYEVSYEGPARLTWTCRPSALMRAITNVIDNATKHGTSVSVALHADNDVVQIDVSDNGRGIPTSLHEKVFEPFFKVEAPGVSAEPVGFGLGLSIARNVVKSHGGTIELRNRSFGGLVVRLSLPELLAHEQF
jgi:signal transduction histidine kinase